MANPIRFLIAAFWVTMVLLALNAHAQNRRARPGYTSDNSDWWSFTAARYDPEIPKQNREPSPENLQILGIELGKDVLPGAASKLGKASVVERGDGASARSQVCYVSEPDEPRVHLAFEEGEVNTVLYLFEGGQDWSGSDQCSTSQLVTKNLHTGSGIGLGQSPAEVQAILARPSKATVDKLIYSFVVDKKTSEEDLRRMHERYREMTEQDLRANFESCSLTVYIEVRFSRSKLVYLAVSRSMVY